MKNDLQKIVFIGAGNLATHLSLALKQAGYPILQVYSRTNQSAKTLADKLDSTYTTEIKELSESADIYFIALKDSVLQEVLSKIEFNNKMLVHTSGSLPLSVLCEFTSNYGVLYPLQTFSKNRELNFREIPVFVEASGVDQEKLLFQLAEKVADKVNVLDSAQRKKLHIAAVFACNFVNHFYTLAAEFLNDSEIAFEVMHPLIIETAKKAAEMPPEQAQTGPAVRFDEYIINDHLENLKNYPLLKELYNSISRSIFEFHQKNK